MLKNWIIGVAIIGASLFFFNCQDEKETQLKYLLTEYGGCNGMTGGVGGLAKDALQHDTLYWQVDGDMLKIFIGKEYICCAPFVIDLRQSRDTLTIVVRDTCKSPYESCYCRCICYYEFLSYFENYSGGKYQLNVYLYDPRQPRDTLLWAVKIP